MGLRPFGDAAHLIPMLATGIRETLLSRHHIEIMAAFGHTRGMAWRVELMTYNAEAKNILHFLAAFEEVLRDAGLRLPPRAGIEAAAQTLCV